jgi:biotin transport system substrate-specific component
MEAGTRHKVLMDVVIPGARTESRANRLALDASLVIGFAFLVALCAQIAFKIPTTTVPITGQTFGVLLTGGALGSRRGALSMLVYMLVGMASLPVFAPKSGFLGEKTFHLVFPWSGSSGQVWDMSSGGYIVGFVLAAYLVGLLAERGWARRSTVPLAMVAGNLSIYLIGLTWLAVFIASGATIPGLDLTYYDAISGSNVLDKTLRGGLFPFIGGDALKLLAAALVLPGAWSLVDRIRGRPPGD